MIVVVNWCRFHQVDSDDMTIAVNFWWQSYITTSLSDHMDAYYLRRILRRCYSSIFFLWRKLVFHFPLSCRSFQFCQLLLLFCKLTYILFPFVLLVNQPWMLRLTDKEMVCIPPGFVILLHIILIILGCPIPSNGWFFLTI